MTLSQRLTRAGLSFIVFGTAVSLMPTDGMAIADTSTCVGGISYRLTTDASGLTDTQPPTNVPVGTQETFYFFQSTSTGTFLPVTPVTPSIFTSSGYTTVSSSGNVYIGDTTKGNNTVVAKVSGGPSVSDGTVISP